MIGQWHLQAIAAQIGADVEGQDVAFTSVSTDTRTLQPGALYVALQGERFDGHEFVAEAIAKGAVAAMVARPVQAAVPLIWVADTRWGLGRLGALNRARFGGRVAAVTGSSGKTTVKEMLAAVLRQAGDVLATRGNLNNDIGVPLTLLELTENQQFAVIELGASAVGEIAYTVALAQPDVAAITNAGGAHLEGFGGIEGVRRAKGEIYAGLSEQSTAVINQDDPAFAQWQDIIDGRHTLSFGGESADFYARNIRDQDGTIEFELVTPAGQVPVSMAFSGQHNVTNALTAAAMASALGLDLAQIAAGLASAKPAKGRLNRERTRAGGLLLDDTYNANPASVKAALRVLAAQQGLRVALLGDMAELGTDAPQLHSDVGRFAKSLGIERLLACGRFARATAEGFGLNAEAFELQADLIEHIQTLCQPDTVFLVKGSRSARMERVVESLVAVRDDVKC